MRKYVCSVCGHIVESDSVPSCCPMCEAEPSKLEEEKEEEVVEEKVEDSTANLDSSSESNKSIAESPQIESKPVQTVNAGVKTCDIENDEKFMELLKTAQVQAVKMYRERYGCGLKEAKDAVDQIAAKHGIQYIQPNAGSGCVITLLIAMTSTLSLMFIL